MGNNDDWLEEPYYKKTWFIVTIVLLAIVIVLLFIPSGKSETNYIATPETEIQTPIAPVNWEYSKTHDKMENSTIYYAECYSDNRILFDFPYNQEGGSYFTLIVRKMKKNEVLITVSKGQFLSGYNRVVKLKFDNENTFNVGCSSSSDGSSETIFLSNSAKIISKLKKAKKVMIEVEFYDFGRQILEFTVKDLKWEH